VLARGTVDVHGLGEAQIEQVLALVRLFGLYSDRAPLERMTRAIAAARGGDEEARSVKQQLDA